MSNWIKHSCLVILGLMGLKSTAADAAVDMSLCIDGVAGDVQASKSDAGCIDVLAWSWGASNSSSIFGPGKANFQDISFTKFQDSTSTFLMQAVATSKVMPEVQLRVRRACDIPGCVGILTAQYTLSPGGYVTSVSTGGSGGEDRLTENVTINFPGIEWCYALDITGAPADPPDLVCASVLIASP